MSDYIEGVEPYKFVPQIDDIRRQAHEIGSLVLSMAPMSRLSIEDFTDSIRLQITDDERDLMRLPPPIRDTTKVPRERYLSFNMPTHDQLCNNLEYYDVGPDEIAELYAGTGLAARLLEEMIDTKDREQVQTVIGRLGDNERFSHNIFNSAVFSLDEKVELLESFEGMDADDIVRINVLRFAFGLMAQVSQMDQGYVDEILDPALTTDKRAAQIFADGIRATFKARDSHAKLLRALGRDDDFISQHNADLFSHFELAACFPMDNDEIKYILNACWPSVND